MLQTASGQGKTEVVAREDSVLIIISCQQLRAKHYES